AAQPVFRARAGRHRASPVGLAHHAVRHARLRQGGGYAGRGGYSSAVLQNHGGTHTTRIVLRRRSHGHYRPSGWLQLPVGVVIRATPPVSSFDLPAPVLSLRETTARAPRPALKSTS